MNCDSIRASFVDYLDGTTGDERKLDIEAHLKDCPSCRAELEAMKAIDARLGAMPAFEPPEAVTERFHAMLRKETAPHAAQMTSATAEKARTVASGTHFFSHPVLQAAAALIILAGGFVAGGIYERTRSNGEEIFAIKSEMHDMRLLLTTALLSQESAVERLRGVSMSGSVAEADDRLLSALLKTLNTDPDVNVRLAASDALRRYSDREWVRKELVESLTRQTSPLVQVYLIDTFVEMRDREALPAIESLIADEYSIEPVKERARLAIDRII